MRDTANSSRVLFEKLVGEWRRVSPRLLRNSRVVSDHFVKESSHRSNTFLILVLEALAMAELFVARVPDADLEEYRSHPKSPPVDHARVVQHCDQIIFLRCPQAFL